MIWRRWSLWSGQNKYRTVLNGRILLRGPRFYQSCSAIEEEELYLHITQLCISWTIKYLHYDGQLGKKFTLYKLRPIPPPNSIKKFHYNYPACPLLGHKFPAMTVNHIVKQASQFAVDISPCPVLSPTVTLLLPSHDHP